MPTTIFDWIARTAMLAMAGLVTLSILGAIATMTNDPGTRFAAGGRPAIEGERAQERDPVQAPSRPEEGDVAAAAAPAGSQESTIVAARPDPEDKAARWLEAIAYALLALAGIGALGVLMLWSILRELRRIGRSPG
ncbi:MAG: hypothetical protein ACXW27_16530 [Allosphingosinicella sp.]